MQYRPSRLYTALLATLALLLTVFVTWSPYSSHNDTDPDVSPSSLNIDILLNNIPNHRATNRHPPNTHKDHKNYTQPPFTCPKPNYIQTLTTISPSVQLQTSQLTWIASTIASTPIPSTGRNVLIFGLGNDSPIYYHANCFQNPYGRTIYLENWSDWYTKITKQYPYLEAYKQTYLGRVDESEAFFKNPWVLDVPDEIRGVCFDVVLVDAPQGYEGHHPGRMEAGYWSMVMGEECIRRGVLKKVVVFLHDVERQVEKKVVTMFNEDFGVQEIGCIENLCGFMMG